MTIVEFLLARIDEDEALARTVRRDEYLTERDALPLMDAAEGTDRFIRITSSRVLAECQAKRRLLSELADELADDPSDFTAGKMLKWLASPYATHPDFQPEWAAV